MPSRSGGVHVRVSSPSGDSTLTTSAPMSANNIVAYGPASTREKSATSTPDSAPAMLSSTPRTTVRSDRHGLVRHGGQSREVGTDLAGRGEEQREVLLDEPIHGRLGRVRVDVHRGDHPPRAVAQRGGHRTDAEGEL